MTLSDDHTDHTDVEADDGGQLVLGPEEIVNYPLRKATRGYRTDEVDDLLDQLAVQTQDLLSELHQLEDERDLLRRQLAEASETESMLKKTLVTAQRAAEASVAEAHEEADQLRQRARQRVEELLSEAAEQAHELREAALRRARADEADIRRYRRGVEEHVEALRTFAADHRARLAHHLELQRERLAEMDLPDAPAPPEVVEDEILDTEVQEVDVKGLVAELAGDQEAPRTDDAEGEVQGSGHGDVQAADAGEQGAQTGASATGNDGAASEADTAERLFGS